MTTKADNVYSRLQAARVELQGMALKETGQNKFAGYSYMELGDFLPQINNICAGIGLCGVVTFSDTIATLTIVNTDNIEEKIVFTSPMSTAELKGCHAIQQLGAVQSYLRRYLWLAAFEIVEHDALDATTGKKELEKGKQQPQKTDPSATLSEAQQHLLSELDEYAVATGRRPADVLKECRYYKTESGKEGYLTVEDVKKPNSNEKFQKYIGATLGKLRAKKEGK